MATQRTLTGRSAQFADMVSSGTGARALGYGRMVPVPPVGSLQLFAPGQTTVGVRINRPGRITGASIQVDAADGARTYDLDIRVNAVSAATVALPLGATGAHSAALSVALVAGDAITVFMVRTAGLGISTFLAMESSIEVTT